MTKGKFAVVVDFEIAEDHIDAFRSAIGAQAKNSLDLEEGCYQFDVLVDPLETGRFVLYEVYEDEAAFEAHLASAHFAQFAADVEPMVKERIIRRLHRA